MDKYICTFDRFFNVVKEHKIKIIRDDGVNRHIMFTSGSFEGWFELITWHNCLCINGDYGTYVFSRTEDMFRFFRTGIRKDGNLSVNESYWHEKMQSNSSFGGAKKFSSEKL